MIHKYLEIKGGKKPETTADFYLWCRRQLRLITLQGYHSSAPSPETTIINNDPDVGLMKVVMVENYNVSC